MGKGYLGELVSKAELPKQVYKSFIEGAVDEESQGGGRYGGTPQEKLELAPNARSGSVWSR